MDKQEYESLTDEEKVRFLKTKNKANLLLAFGALFWLVVAILLVIIITGITIKDAFKISILVITVNVFLFFFKSHMLIYFDYKEEEKHLIEKEED